VLYRRIRRNGRKQFILHIRVPLPETDGLLRRNKKGPHTADSSAKELVCRLNNYDIGKYYLFYIVTYFDPLAKNFFESL
jgi:hypothetical protein